MILVRIKVVVKEIYFFYSKYFWNIYCVLRIFLGGGDIVKSEVNKVFVLVKMIFLKEGIKNK